MCGDDNRDPRYRLAQCSAVAAELAVLRMPPGGAGAHGSDEGTRARSVYGPNGDFAVVTHQLRAVYKKDGIEVFAWTARLP